MYQRIGDVIPVALKTIIDKVDYNKVDKVSLKHINRIKKYINNKNK